MSIAAVIASLLIAGLFVLLAGVNPLAAYREILQAGFGCRITPPPHPLKYCAVLSTLAMTTPLILSGLSAVIAFRAGLFSLGQAGQMLLGAALASSVGGALGRSIPLALIAGALAGAAWAFVPGLLRVWLGISEVLTTLIFNALAGITAGSLAGWGYLDPAARLAPLAFNTKLNAGLFVALALAVAAHLYLGRAVPGYEQRMAGDAPRFASAAGIRSRAAILRALLISGALAGLGGAVEVLGVHYRFVGTFSGGGGFDGVVVAVLGHAQPAGVVIASFLLAGLRLGAMNGLQMHLGIPRELGNIVIAITLILVSVDRFRERRARHSFRGAGHLSPDS